MYKFDKKIGMCFTLKDYVSSTKIIWHWWNYYVFLREWDLNQNYLEHKSLIVLNAVAILLKIFVIMVEKIIDVAKSYGK